MKTQEIKRAIFIITVVGNLIAMLDSTSVNLALYPISRDLGVPIDKAQWVIVAYMLVLTTLLPFFGKLGDMVPKNKLYACGFLVFALGGILNATASSLTTLVAFRCIQALGASAMISNATAIIASIFKDKNRGKALGLNGTVIAVGGMTGPSIGGVLLNYFGWKAVFLPSVPIAIMGIWFAYKLLPSRLPRKKANSPLISFDIFKIKVFALGNLAVLASYMCMFTNGVLLPIFLLDIKGFNPMIAGLLVLPYSISMSFTAPFSGSFAGKHGSKDITRIGPIIMIFSLLICLTLDENSRIPIIIITSAIMGFGSGLFQSPSNTAIITSVKKSELGMASGILALSRNLGNIMGIALTISLFSNLRGVFLERGVTYSTAFLQAYHITICAGIAFGLMCLALAFFAYNER